MKFYKPPKAHIIGFWLSMPFITLALCYILYDDRLFSEWKIAAVSYPIIYFIGYFSWRIHTQYDLWLRNRYPSLEETKKRVLYKTASNLMVMTPSILLIFYFFHWLHILGYSIQKNDLIYCYLV